MRFLVNANMGRIVADRLIKLGHDAEMVVDVLPAGARDSHVLQYSVDHSVILVTRDKTDFGTLVFGQGLPYYGIVVIRYASASDDIQACDLIQRAITNGQVGCGQFVSL